MLFTIDSSSTSPSHFSDQVADKQAVDSSKGLLAEYLHIKNTYFSKGACYHN